MENGDEVVARSVSGTCPRQNDSLLEIRIRGKLRGYEFLWTCLEIIVLYFRNLELAAFGR